jgi:steroid delta-isomerase-like uncharacterized protein
VSEVNKAIVRRFVDEVVNRGDLGAVDELVAPNFLEHDALIPGAQAGRESAKRQYALLHAGFPDLKVTVEDYVAEGERVALRSVWRGTHRGEFLGVAPTGRTIALENLELLRLQRGQIIEHWGLMDGSTLLTLLGVPQKGEPA